MHLILTGATGLVGSSVLDAMIANKEVNKISILTRRPVKMADDRNDPRVQVILHQDFTTYDAALLDKLRGADACVWALGISQTKVNAEDYVKITKDYALAAADAFSTLSPTSSLPTSQQRPFRFIYVSGEGATHSPGRFSAIFARTKGDTERALANTAERKPQLLRADCVRPAYVDSSKHEAIRAYIPNAGLLYNTAELAFGPAIRVGYRSMHSPTEMLGAFMTQLAMGKLDTKLDGPGCFRLGPSWIVGNIGFRRIMGL
ncbi:hypothetical protein HIM_09226 [Hirsutella minnesotensis 3608]|uniref:NAD(P)-binding domain-containing protein n=1 Tax=Hirsutella minnesotensis 3608 TaxID=1043627 RepID=A0A0F7ZLR8_9HYPO|nr:hypothetical protein HIM_09226 [Hirsutella minnesotensis 3608]